MENAWSTMPDRIPGLLKQWGQYSRSTEQDDPWRMVAFGDRKDFLQVLSMVHFLRKCTMRKPCKRDAAEAEPLPARDPGYAGRTSGLAPCAWRPLTNRASRGCAS